MPIFDQSLPHLARNLKFKLCNLNGSTEKWTNRVAHVSFLQGVTSKGNYLILSID